MKTLKVKSFFFSLLTVFAVAVLISSCEQATTDTLENVQGIEDATDGLEDRGGFYLNSQGDSHIHWPYANSSYINGTRGTNNWRVTCGPNCGWHHGGDYYADDWSNRTCGTDFKAPISGKVIFSGYSNNGFGNQVIIQSTDNYNFAFRVAHLEHRSVWNGQWVNAGQVIGRVGTTGNSTGCHGHVVLYKNIYERYVSYQSWHTGLWRLQQGYGLGSTNKPWVGPNKFAAPYYFDAGNKSAKTSGGKTKTTKQDDLDGIPSCGQVHEIETHTSEMIRLEEK